MPSANTIAHVVLLSLAVISLAIAVIFARLKRSGWLAWHRLIAAAGVILGVSGVLTKAIAKHLNGWPHFVTPHSRAGLTAVLLMLTAPVLGVLLLKGRKKLRHVHRAVGGAAILASIAAAVLGVLMVS
jgi:uncharacterized membrane protein YjfL (UPF0719 family)